MYLSVEAPKQESVVSKGISSLKPLFENFFPKTVKKEENTFIFPMGLK